MLYSCSVGREESVRLSASSPAVYAGDDVVGASGDILPLNLLFELSGLVFFGFFGGQCVGCFARFYLCVRDWSRDRWRVEWPELSSNLPDS